MEIKCELIRDILPLYVEGLCGETTKSVVDEHTAQCEDCGRLLKELAYENTAFAARSEARIAAAPFLKIKRRNRLKIVGVSAAAVIVFAALFVKLFLIGAVASTSSIGIQSIHFLDESTFEIEATSNSAFQAIQHIGFAATSGMNGTIPQSGEGEVYCRVYTVAALPFTENGAYKTVVGFGVGDLNHEGITAIYIVGKDESDVKLIWEK